MPHIKYVGKKDEYTDHLYGTESVWSPGDIFPVEARVASKMIQHTDVWQLASPDEIAERYPPADMPEPAPAAAETIAAAGTLPEKEPIEDDQRLHAQNLQHMAKPQIIEYVARGFGVSLDSNMKIQDMRTKARDLRAQAGIIGGR